MILGALSAVGVLDSVLYGQKDSGNGEAPDCRRQGDAGAARRDRARSAGREHHGLTVPLCRGHHRQLHQAGNEVAWWETLKIDALRTARQLWEQTTQTKDRPTSPVKAQPKSNDDRKGRLLPTTITPSAGPGVTRSDR